MTRQAGGNSLLRAYVINLDRDRRRMDRMARCLEQLGVKYTRMPAVYRPDVPAGIALSSPEYGNFLSQRKCWKAIVDGSEPFGLCLEDDVVFARNFAEMWNDERLLESGFDILRLEAFPGKRISVGKPVSTVAGGYEIRTLHSSAVGAAGYLVSRRAAEWLLQHAKPTAATDLILFEEDAVRRLRIQTLLPGACCQYHFLKDMPYDPDLSESTIGPLRSWVPGQPKTLTQRIHKPLGELSRFVDRCLHG